MTIFRIVLVACAMGLAACGSSEPYKSKVASDAGSMAGTVWLRSVTFKPTPEQVYPVDVERQLALSAQKDMQTDARQWLTYFMTQRSLAAPSEQQAKYVLDVVVSKIEIEGALKGMAYSTDLTYRISEAGAQEPIFEQEIADAGFHDKEDNLTWGDVIGAVGVGLTGVPAVGAVGATTAGSKSGLQPTILRQSLIYTWRDSIGKNADRYLSDLPAVLPYKLDEKKRNQAQANGAPS